MKKGWKKPQIKGNEYVKASHCIMSAGVSIKTALDLMTKTDPNEWYSKFMEAADALEAALLILQTMYEQYPIVFSLMRVYAPVGMSIKSQRNPYYDPKAAKEDSELPSDDDDEFGDDPF